MRWRASRPSTTSSRGATHEFLIVSLNPEYGDKDVTRGQRGAAKQWSGPRAYIRFALREGMPYLAPVDVCIQFEGTDEEMRQLAAYACRAIVAGRMSPDQDYREGWKTSLVKTLAHLRGEVHGP